MSRSRCGKISQETGHHRRRGRYLLHEFMLMADHFHVLSYSNRKPGEMQLIKRGFSFRARKELGFGTEIWQKSFYDRRVRDVDEYYAFGKYIHRNPLKRRLVSVVEQYAYSSA
jgi:putative transposase